MACQLRSVKNAFVSGSLAYYMECEKNKQFICAYTASYALYTRDVLMLPAPSSPLMFGNTSTLCSLSRAFLSVLSG